jgi:hypothetical protein
MANVQYYTAKQIDDLLLGYTGPVGVNLHFIGSTNINLVPITAGTLHISDSGNIYADLPGGTRVTCTPEQLSSSTVGDILTAAGF